MTSGQEDTRESLRRWQIHDEAKQRMELACWGMIIDLRYSRVRTGF